MIEVDDRVDRRALFIVRLDPGLICHHELAGGQPARAHLRVHLHDGGLHHIERPLLRRRQ
ncbi:MAG TPA: hypothetical protein VGA37_14280 [Gemmatimonadales bacterium]